jgi:hypothetical protein
MKKKKFTITLTPKSIKKLDQMSEKTWFTKSVIVENLIQNMWPKLKVNFNED